MEQKQKYYGPSTIVAVEEAGVDNSLHKLTLSDATTVTLSTEMLNVAVKESPIDLTELRNVRCYPVVAEILGTLLKWNVKVDEIAFITERVIMSINDTMKKADEKLWGTTNDQKTMVDVNNVLL